MGFEVGLVGGLVAVVARRLLDEFHDTADAGVECCLWQFVVFHGVQDGGVLLLTSWLQHVVACCYLLCAVCSAKPVGHHRALEAPLVAQHGLQQFAVL